MSATLDGKTIFMSGGSRGIGLAIALRAARDGANVALMAKTAEPQPKLEGTVHTAAAEIEAAGGRALPIVGDVRGAGFFWALELVCDSADGRLDADTREALLRGYLPGRLLEAGLIARPDDRGDAVLHVAPPLVCGRDELDLLVDRVGEVLTDAGDVLTRRGILA